MPSQTLPELMEQVDRIERQVLAISEHLGLPFDSPLRAQVPDEVASLVAEGNKLAAVRRYRELTGAGIGEAQEAIDQLASS
jgi:ribosomal protein L7/L12